MRSLRSLETRIERLERGRANPFAEFGTPEFATDFRASVEANRLDPIDMLGETGNGGVLACLQRWARDFGR